MAAVTTTGLLERSEQLEQLDETLETVASERQGRLVLVRGEAGIGKTTLLRRFCEAQPRAIRVVWGNCDPLFTPRPLGPLFGVSELEELIRRDDVMPHEVVTALALEFRRPAPTIFVLEDVHWADEATLDVLRLLSRRLDGFPALVLASYRDDELERAPLLRIVLGELATNDRAARVKLFPLSPEAVAQLAESGDVDPDELYRKTGGNPFFVVEAIEAGADEIPETVRDAVFARAAQLSPPARGVLEAVAGRPAAGRAATARSARRRRHARARRVPCRRDADHGLERHRLPARAGAPRGRGVDRAGAQARAPSSRSRCARGPGSGASRSSR